MGAFQGSCKGSFPGSWFRGLGFRALGFRGLGWFSGFQSGLLYSSNFAKFIGFQLKIAICQHGGFACNFKPSSRV